MLSACLFSAAGLAGLYAQAPARATSVQPVIYLGKQAIQRWIAQLAVTNNNWLGGAGNWNTATSWSLGSVPNASNNVVIGGSSPPAVVQLNVSDAIKNLAIGSSSVLSFNNNNSLTVGGKTINNTNSTGAGGITLNSSGNTTALVIDNPAVSLTGGGIVTLGDNSSNYIFGAAGTDVLTNLDNTIQGSGRIGNGQMGLVNQGTVDANQLTPLTIRTSSGVTNTGIMEATNGGSLVLNGDTYTNTGGTILASGTNSVVTLLNPVINGGTLNTTDGGLIQASGTPVLNGVANTGAYRLPDGSNTVLQGAIVNSGSIQVNSTGSSTALSIGGDTTLSGNGTIALSDNPNNIVQGVAGTEVLTSSNTIEGSGNLGNNLLGLVNNGTVLANQSTALFVRPNSSGFTNNGIVQVNAGSTLDITGGPFTNFNSATRTLTGGSYIVGGTLQFDNANIVTNAANITLSGPAAQIVSDTNTNALANFNSQTFLGTFTVSNGGSFTTSGAFTNSGNMDLEAGGKLTVSGDLTNGGNVATNSTDLHGAPNTLTVTGTYTSTNGSAASLIIGANNDSSDKASVGLLANGGTITVGTGASLTLTTAGTDTNSGVINLNGTLDIKARTTLSGTGTMNLTGGAITGLGAGPLLTNGIFIHGSGTISNLIITNTGTLSADQSAPLIILPAATGFNNRGSITVAAGSTMEIGTPAGGALVNFAGNTLTNGSFNVSGTLQFGSSGTFLANNAANITLNGAAARIVDFGNNNILVGFNNNAAAGKFQLTSGASLTTSAGSFTNAGRFTISTGSVFTVGGSSFDFTQTAGTTTVDGALTATSLGTLNLNGGSLFGGGTLGYNVVDSGTLSPGDSIGKVGTLTVADTYTQTAGGTLDIAIAGPSSGKKFDQLKVTQNASLGGTLNISLVNGFTPAVGQTYVIVSASAIGNTFTNVNGLPINSSEHFTITYNGTSVVLKVVSGALSAGMRQARNYYGPAIDNRRTGHLPPSAPIYAPSHTPALSGFRPRDVNAAPAAQPFAAGISGSSTSAYNTMGAMNHLRFECGVDLKAALKLSRKQLLHGLLAAPDSPRALAIGYVSYTGAR